ncbi:unnamed protein product [Sphagnum jensenii]|uniref:Protein kinase domain-containing protein n=1 Tax=Sphagnum jensenii TaxID=128206 RepID=A0ABP0X245_9BRYO
MSQKVRNSKRSISIDDELFPEDYDRFGTAVNVKTGEPSRTHPWVDPNILKLMHRIGRGPFGDVWLATIHNCTEDFNEYHEVAVKMLPPGSEEQVRSSLRKFESVFHTAQGLRGVSWPYGISIKDGRACIIMKFYEGSIGDKLARLPGNKLPLADVLRYGQQLVSGIMELHSRGILALNLKPCNFLLDNQNVAVVGEFGIPMLCGGISSPSSEHPYWVGSPNYMAPEQWGANLRGPISFETDCWAFACSIIEMITGEKPWNHVSPQDIFDAVVVRHQKPMVPSGLPPVVDKVLKACFEYDYRNRPAFGEILHALTHVLVQYCDKPGELVHCSSSCLHLWKDLFQIGDSVIVKDWVDSPRFGWPGEFHQSEGIVSEIGVQDGVILVTFRGSQETWRADPVELEHVSGGLVANDWVRLRSGWSLEANPGQMPSRVGIVHHVEHSGKLKVAFFGRETLYTASPVEFEKVSSFFLGQYVRLKVEVVAPRFHWPQQETGGWDTGRIASVLPNGGLFVKFPGRLFTGKGVWADPEETDVVHLNEISGVINKYQHIQKMHWAVRPTLALLGFLIAARTGVVIVNLVTRPIRGRKEAALENKAGRNPNETMENGKDSPSSGNPVWLPSQVAVATSTVASLIFGEGVTTPTR